MNDLVDELYNYLVTNNQGVREGIKRKELAEKFGVSERAITDAKNKINTNAEYSKRKETEKEARFGSFKRKLKVLKIALGGLKKNNELHK